MLALSTLHLQFAGRTAFEALFSLCRECCACSSILSTAPSPPCRQAWQPSSAAQPLRGMLRRDA